MPVQEITRKVPEGAISLKEGEELCVVPGKIQAMSDVSMITQFVSGVLESVKRFFFYGPSCFNNRIRAEKEGGWVLLEETMPGQVEGVNLTSGESIKIRRDRLIAFSPSIQLETVFEGPAGLFQGTGIAMLKATLKADGLQGKIYFHSDEGIVKKIEVLPGAKVTIDNDSILGYTQGLESSLQTNGVKSFFFGGEGILCDFYGKGTIYVASTPQDKRSYSGRNSLSMGVSVISPTKSLSSTSKALVKV